MKKHLNRKKQEKKAFIDMAAHGTLYDDVKNTPEFKHGYEKEMLQEFAGTIKKLRTEKGLTQKQVAVKVGTKQQVISKLENGVDDIKLSTFFKIANVLHMDLEKFVHAARR